MALGWLVFSMVAFALSSWNEQQSGFASAQLAEPTQGLPSECPDDRFVSSERMEVHTRRVELPTVVGAVLRTSHAEFLLVPAAAAASTTGCIAVQSTLHKVEPLNVTGYAPPADTGSLSSLAIADVRPVARRNLTDGVVIVLPLLSPVNFRALDAVPVCRWRATRSDAWTADRSCEVVAYNAVRVTCRCSHLGEYSVSSRRRSQPSPPGRPDAAARRLHSRTQLPEPDDPPPPSVAANLVAIIAVPVTSLVAIAVFAGCVICRGSRVSELAPNTVPSSPCSSPDSQEPPGAGDEANLSPTASSDSNGVRLFAPRRDCNPA
eukprot:TRINITY_DN3470_c0_g1_i2.p1 TRINITY_DN3470_c0_g1~~TRINITY_DN3470_c0_g1_i2.p1  ORF type:complete len:320 (-),score=83.63 TRINITY_DN3470_c0_g1_i2:212-1171(-)